MPPISHAHAAFIADASSRPAASPNAPAAHVSGRVAVSSVANLLFVLLLRLNHVLAPAIVRLFRARHHSWIERVTADVQAELRRDPNARRLCAGACCQRTYGTFERAANGGAPRASVTLWVQAVAAATDMATRTAHDIAAAAEHVQHVLTGDAAKARARAPGEAEIYFTLRVQQEARHRRAKRLRVLDEQLVLMVLTLFTVVLYGGAIIAAVQYWYRLQLWELGVFSASLLSTALLAEGATLKMAWRRLFASTQFGRDVVPGEVVAAVGEATSLTQAQAHAEKN